MACRPYNTGRCLLLRLFNPSKLWGSLQTCPLCLWELKRELLELHQETDKEVQKTKMQHFGEVLTDIVMPDLQTSETESSLEINFLIGKIKHTVKRVRKDDSKK